MSLNFIFSLLDFLESHKDTLGVKTVNRVTPEEKDLPAIIIREGTTSYRNIEIGGKGFVRRVPIYFEIFATNDGERLKIKDALVSLLRHNDIPLYECTLSGDQIVKGNLICYLSINFMEDYRIDLGTDKAQLDLIDRYRHLVNVEFNLNKVE